MRYKTHTKENQNVDNEKLVVPREDAVVHDGEHADRVCLAHDEHYRTDSIRTDQLWSVCDTHAE